MTRKQTRPPATQQVVLEPLQITCRMCGSRMRMGHHSHRTVTTLQGVTRLTRHPSIGVVTRSAHAFTCQRGQRKKGDGHCPMENLAWTSSQQLEPGVLPTIAAFRRCISRCFPSASHLPNGK